MKEEKGNEKPPEERAAYDSETKIKPPEESGGREAEIKSVEPHSQ